MFDDCLHNQNVNSMRTGVLSVLSFSIPTHPRRCATKEIFVHLHILYIHCMSLALERDGTLKKS